MLQAELDNLVRKISFAIHQRGQADGSKTSPSPGNCLLAFLPVKWHTRQEVWTQIESNTRLCSLAPIPQGHYARVVDLSDSQEEPSGLHHEGTGVLVDIHRRHSLDVCLCVGAACKDSMRSTQVCRRLGVTVVRTEVNVMSPPPWVARLIHCLLQVHDPADTAGLVEMLGNVKDGDVLLSSSRQAT